ncbi:hypothetical protein [Christiangramia crocea]|uniref:Uncharacterized protein n=1 Tax=Christiangramia crocea TaxID=2904124 RepID=A0A9X1UV69_9FLAO|nr:hypothetical protein [Gramella crocea]MCG9971002.1 hypothetical protein [Gramella crocea]
MQTSDQPKSNILNSIEFENETTVKIELNRPANMSKRMLARYIFKKLQHLN